MKGRPACILYFLSAENHGTVHGSRLEKNHSLSWRNSQVRMLPSVAAATIDGERRGAVGASRLSLGLIRQQEAPGQAHIRLCWSQHHEYGTQRPILLRKLAASGRYLKAQGTSRVSMRKVPKIKNGDRGLATWHCDEAIVDSSGLPVLRVVTSHAGSVKEGQQVGGTGHGLQVRLNLVFCRFRTRGQVFVLV